MITYLKEYNTGGKNNEINNNENEEISTPQRLSGIYLPLINSQFSIPADMIINYLHEKGKIDYSYILSLSDILKKIPSVDQISKSQVPDNPDIDEEELNKEYENFSLNSRMKFPYSVNMYSSNNTIISFFSNLKTISDDLNYISFLAKNKSEIDDSIKKSIDLLRYELVMGIGPMSNEKLENKSFTTEDLLEYMISPYCVDKYSLTNQPYNNPFVSFNDYKLFLLSPNRNKIALIENITGYFSSSNILLKNFITGGIVSLKKSVITYRANDIIELFIICLYLIRLLLEYINKYTCELHDIAKFVHEESTSGDLNESEVFIPETIHNKIRLIDLDESDGYSREELNQLGINPSPSDRIKLNEIDEQYKRKWAQLQKAYIKIFKVGLSKIISKVNSLFFKKYYGRIPHLFREYGHKAEVVENTMAGDPGEILSTLAVDYVERMTEDSTSLFNNLLQIAKRIASVGNIEEKVNIINTYCKKFPLDKDNPDSIKNNILNETRYRIAESILQDNTIYGFTVDGILQNRKFPPANHIVTSLFVKNPHEKPIQQTVSDIFTDDNNILLFANPKDILKFNNLYRQSASKIIDSFNPKLTSIAEKNIARSGIRFAQNVIDENTDETAISSGSQIDAKEQKKISQSIDKAVIGAIDMAIAQKRRCLQCAGIAHDMISRVTDLAKRCVVSMLMVEKSLTDTSNGRKPTYNSGNKMTTNKRVSKQLEANRQHIENRNE
jgi:hypothetical protein